MKGLEIMSANEMRKITDYGQQEYEKTILSGVGFRAVMREIEDTALGGGRSIEITADNLEHVRELEVIGKELRKAGYEADVIVSERKSIFNQTYKIRTFTVTW